MFSKALLASLLVSAAVAAPAPAAGDAAAPPIIKLQSNVSCTSVVASSTIPGPSPSIILLNSPSALPPVASGDYGNYAAPAQPSLGPINKLSAPTGAPPIIKLNRRQFGPASSTNTFSFGGIVPPSTPPAFPPSLPTTTSSSASSSATTTDPAVQGGLSTFTTTGVDGIKTVLILSAVTVTVTGGPPCSSPPAFPSSGPAPGFPPALSVLPPTVPSSSFPAVNSPPPSFAGANAQNPAPVIPIAVTTSSLSPIILNTPSVTPTPTPTPFPVAAAASANCDLDCLLTATV